MSEISYILIGVAVTATIYNAILLNKLITEFKSTLEYQKQFGASSSHSRDVAPLTRMSPITNQSAAAQQDLKLSVPTLEPQMISKNIANPPKPKGGFGTSVDGV